MKISTHAKGGGKMRGTIKHDGIVSSNRSPRGLKSGMVSEHPIMEAHKAFKIGRAPKHA